MNPYTLETIENWVSDFCTSDAAAREAPGARDAGAPLLVAFLVSACEHRERDPDELEEDDVRHGLLSGVAELALDDAARAAAPAWCAALLAELEAGGRLARGRALGTFVRALAPAFRDAAAPSAPTIVNPGSRIGRNDPCPCGSGKKYKKCCMNA